MGASRAGVRLLAFYDADQDRLRPLRYNLVSCPTAQGRMRSQLNVERDRVIACFSSGRRKYGSIASPFHLIGAEMHF